MLMISFPRLNGVVDLSCASTICPSSVVCSYVVKTAPHSGQARRRQTLGCFVCLREFLVVVLS